MPIKNLIKQFKELRFYEKVWVIFNPLAAKKTIEITGIARKTANEMINYADLDGHAAGGQVDAFRHAFRMVMLSRKIGAKKAYRLGVANENGNYADYKSKALEEGLLPTNTFTQMYLHNNKPGAEIGKKNPDLSDEELKELVKTTMLKEKALTVNKNKNGEFLSKKGEIILKQKYYGKWYTPINPVYSNQ